MIIRRRTKRNEKKNNRSTASDMYGGYAAANSQPCLARGFITVRQHIEYGSGRAFGL